MQLKISQVTESNSTNNKTTEVCLWPLQLVIAERKFVGRH